MPVSVSRKITLMNFLMALLIVYYHLPFKDNGLSVWTSVYGNIHEAASQLALGWFFMVSGFLFFCGAKNLSDIRNKQKRRVKTLLIPFVLWQLIIIAGLTILHREFPVHTAEELLLAFSLRPFDAPLWYMFVLVIFVPFAPLLFRLKGRNTLSCFVFAVVLVLCFLTSGTNTIRGISSGWKYAVWTERTVRFLPAYLGGAILAMNWPFAAQWSDCYTKVQFTASLLFVGSIAIVALGKLSGGAEWVMMRVQPFLLWMALSSDIFADIKFSGLSQWSFLIYAMHEQFFLPFLTRFLLHEDYPLPMTAMLHLFSIFVVMCGCYLICLVGNKIPKMKKLLNLLTGNR